jgi:hypothetical protein
VERFSELGESRLDVLVNVAGKSEISFSRCWEGIRRAEGKRDGRDKELGQEMRREGFRGTLRAAELMISRSL